MNQYEMLPKEPKTKKKIKRILAIAIPLCSVVLIGAAVACLFLFGKPPATEHPQENQTESVGTKEDKETQPIIADDEIRGVYIAGVNNINFPSQSGLDEASLKRELDAIVETSRQTGFDTLYFQVRPTCDAFYHSDLFPSSRFVVKTEGDALPVDCLAYLTEKAAEYDMEVVAWVNPYRVTAKAYADKEAAIASLSENNPARKNPDWTVFYGGKLYFNPALQEVRDLICGGVREICRNYDVAGILYDDYFYPYPSGSEQFDDEESYAKSGSNLPLADWRRENVNAMVRQSYETVKAVGEDLTFGVSPFGIWKNASSDPKGSDTRGMEAYSSLYCDAVAWIEGGYIDYISPQIYWERGYNVADFATLTRWWSAQVDGTDVKLVISHAAYKAADFALGGEEVAQQIVYARQFMGSCGSIQYGYSDIAKNSAGLQDALCSVFAEPYEEEELSVLVDGVSFARPTNNLKTSEKAQFVSIYSNPAFPLYMGNAKLGRTKSGFSSYLFPLAMGENVLTLTQNGVDYRLKVTRRSSNSASTLPSFQIKEFTPNPSNGVVIRSMEEIPLSVTAPSGCTVTATLNDISVSLKPTLNPKGSGYLEEVYTGTLAAPTVSEGEDYVSVGTINYRCQKDGENRTAKGAEVFVIPSSLSVTARVKSDYSYLKRSPDSSFYGDYTPASVGMTDEVIALYDGYVQFAFGGFVAVDNCEIQKGTELKSSFISAITTKNNSKTFDFLLSSTANPPVSFETLEECVVMTVFETETSLSGNIKLPKNNALFSSVSVKPTVENRTLTVTFQLKEKTRYYGFDYAYEEGQIRVMFRQPQTLAEGEFPLKGKTVVIDAGHGGTDSGALGFSEFYNEKDLNLAIALKLEVALTELGATVVMTRSEDTTLSLYERMDLLTLTNPDLSVSIHHNSTAESADANKMRGTLGLYWSKAGLSLADSIQVSVASRLGIYEQGAKEQMLALCRNHRFPQALVEVSFICAPAEYEMAMRQDYAEKSADAIKEGILNWYRQQESQ